MFRKHRGRSNSGVFRAHEGAEAVGDVFRAHATEAIREQVRQRKSPARPKKPSKPKPYRPVKPGAA